ncbi:MAG: hypothetical protein ABI472_02975 [Ginsengibacter sp.]
MNFQIMHRQWKFIVTAVGIGILSVLAPWAIISAMGTDVDIESFRKWKTPALIAFVAVSVVVYAFLLFLFSYKKSDSKVNRIKELKRSKSIQEKERSGEKKFSD